MLLPELVEDVGGIEAGIEEITAVKGPGFGGPNAVARIRPVTLKASKEVRLGRIDPKSKYDAEIGLLKLAVSSREQAAPETIAALTDLGVFPEIESAPPADADDGPERDAPATRARACSRRRSAARA